MDVPCPYRSARAVSTMKRCPSVPLTPELEAWLHSTLIRLCLCLVQTVSPNCVLSTLAYLCLIHKVCIVHTCLFLVHKVCLIHTHTFVPALSPNCLVHTHTCALSPNYVLSTLMCLRLRHKLCLVHKVWLVHTRVFVPCPQSVPCLHLCVRALFTKCDLSTLTANMNSIKKTCPVWEEWCTLPHRPVWAVSTKKQCHSVPYPQSVTGVIVIFAVVVVLVNC